MPPLDIDYLDYRGYFSEDDHIMQTFSQLPDDFQHEDEDVEDLVQGILDIIKADKK